MNKKSGEGTGGQTGAKKRAEGGAAQRAKRSGAEASGPAKGPGVRSAAGAPNLPALQKAAMETIGALLEHENEKVRLEAARFLLSERLKRDSARSGDDKRLKEINFTWFD